MKSLGALRTVFYLLGIFTFTLMIAFLIFGFITLQRLNTEIDEATRVRQSVEGQLQSVENEVKDLKSQLRF